MGLWVAHAREVAACSDATSDFGCFSPRAWGDDLIVVPCVQLPDGTPRRFHADALHRHGMTLGWCRGVLRPPASLHGANGAVQSPCGRYKCRGAPLACNDDGDSVLLVLCAR